MGCMEKKEQNNMKQHASKNTEDRSEDLFSFSGVSHKGS